MSDVINTEFAIVNSAQRTNGVTNDFSIEINTRADNFTHITVMQVYVPKSYHLFVSTVTFTVSESGGAPVTISLSLGNYGRDSLADTIKSALNASVGLINAYDIDLIALNADGTNGADTGKMVFISAGLATSVTFTFDENEFPARAMGFIQAEAGAGTIDYNFIDLGGNNFQLTASLVMSVEREATLAIRTNRVNVQNGLLQEVFTSLTSPFGGIVFQNTSPIDTSKELSGSGKTYTFTLTNELGTPINLNGQDYSFSVMLMRKKDKLSEISTILGGILSKS